MAAYLRNGQNAQQTGVFALYNALQRMSAIAAYFLFRCMRCWRGAYAPSLRLFACFAGGFIQHGCVALADAMAFVFSVRRPDGAGVNVRAFLLANQRCYGGIHHQLSGTISSGALNIWAGANEQPNQWRDIFCRHQAGVRTDRRRSAG